MKRIVLGISMILAGTGLASAAGDPAAGKTQFNKCIACHRVGPGAANAVGPELNGVVGRKAASVPGYAYSDALKAANLTWDEATLTKWLEGPAKLVPGTKMTFPGLPAEKDRADVIAYLQTFGADGNPAK